MPPPQNSYAIKVIRCGLANQDIGIVALLNYRKGRPAGF